MDSKGSAFGGSRAAPWPSCYLHVAEKFKGFDIIRAITPDREVGVFDVVGILRLWDGFIITVNQVLVRLWARLLGVV